MGCCPTGCTGCWANPFFYFINGIRGAMMLGNAPGFVHGLTFDDPGLGLVFYGCFKDMGSE